MAEVLVIDNVTRHMSAVETAITEVGYAIHTKLTYLPGIEFEETAAELIPEVDYVWATGGGGLGREANDKAPNGEPYYASEGRVFEMAREAGKPVLAVCMAAQGAAHYYGAKVVPLSNPYEGYKRIYTDGFGTNLGQTEIEQFSSQDFGIEANSAPSIIRIRGVSKDGKIEIFELPGILAVQWHPELGNGTIVVPRLIEMLQHV